MDKIRQLELLEETLDNILELDALSCYSDDHFRSSINQLRTDINELL